MAHSDLHGDSAGRLSRTLADRLGTAVRSARPLYGGCIARVLRIDLADGRRLVVKHADEGGATLDIEAAMLRALAEPGVIRVPEVVHAEPTLLVMEHIDNDGRKSPEGEARLARRLAALHALPADRYGFGQGTLIGPLHQPNPPTDSWARFFAEHRLLAMGRVAESRRSLPAGVMGRLERLSGRVEEVIAPGPARPALIHGDLWSGNVLWNGGDFAAVIDPAVYHADPEMELAFIDLMGGMGRAFWEAYGREAEIREGFRERRRHVYNLYPLLVHAALFGGGYGASVAANLRTIGF